MDYEGFSERLTPQAISKFLLYGDEYSFSATEFDTRPLEERIKDCGETYSNELLKIPNEMLQELLTVLIGKSEDTYFEWGFIAGLTVAKW